VGVGVVQVGEDGQCLMPVVPGGLAVARGLPGVAEMDQGVGLVVAIVQLTEEDERLLEAGARLGLVADAVIGEAETVQRLRLPDDVTELAEQGEGLLAGGDGLAVVAELGVDPADRVEGVRPAELVSGRLSSATGCASWVAIRGVSWLRLVTTTKQPGAPGSRGRTWSASRALSSRSSIRRPAPRLR
jgi:hypothetical protein